MATDSSDTMTAATIRATVGAAESATAQPHWHLGGRPLPACFSLSHKRRACLGQPLALEIMVYAGRISCN